MNPINQPQSIENSSPLENQDIYRQISRSNLFRPSGILLGMLIGFLICCFIGKIVAKTNFYQHFQRFHRYIRPESIYYPTVSQMLAIVESQVKPEQTIVIVGGNSVLNGSGQKAKDLWSRYLQEILGSQYAVFNFAFRAASPFEGGYFAAESLLNKHRKVIYITNVIPPTIGFPEGSAPYEYLYWDATYKHLLSIDQIRKIEIEHRIANSNAKEKESIGELRLCMLLDSYCYFNDLWTSVGYRKVFTVWNYLCARSPFLPRKQYKDDEPNPLPLSKRFTDLISVEEKNMRAALIYQFKKDNNQNWVLNEQGWNDIDQRMDSVIPQQFRKNCLVLFPLPCPFFNEHSNQSDLSRLNCQYKLFVEKMNKLGFHAITAGSNFKNEDYSDRWHLVASGGQKLALEIVESVRNTNKELGYEKP
jgi:hypothetical protein